MPSHTSLYLAHLTQLAFVRIVDELPAASAADRARVAMLFHFGNERSSKFQRYYIRVTNNRPQFLQTKDFFRTFKTEYALQGVDAGHLTLLEGSKPRLLSMITRDRLVPLYREYFADGTILHKGHPVHKNLGSFFAKFVHTFKPETYCALDNPIRELLGLKRESFFQSFLAISAAYRTWISKYPECMAQVRGAVPDDARSHTDQMTDLKLLDLIFWQRAISQPPVTRKR